MAAASRRSYSGPVLRSSFNSSSIRFSLDRNRSISHSTNPSQKRSCMCSPTNHPGSFRCSLHKNNRNSDNQRTTSYCSNKLRRSAMANSLVRIGAVEDVDLVRRPLAAPIRPSSHQLRRRENFRRRNSRLSIMSRTGS